MTSTNDLERLQVIEIMLMDQHKRIGEVADHLGITRVRLWQICKAHGIKPHRPVERICAYCGGKFFSKRSVVRDGGGLYCNDKCYHGHRNEVSDYFPSKQGRRKSRKVIEGWLGFPLPDGFVVHHEDGDNDNFVIGNLFVFPAHSAHLKYHHAKRDGSAKLPYLEMWELPGKIEEWLLAG